MNTNFSWLFDQPKSLFPSSDFRSFDYTGSWQKQFISNYLEEGFSNGFEKPTAKFHNYKDEHLPKSLFKFFPPTPYSLISLENKNLWLSSPSEFNDPFDSYVGVEEDTYIKIYVLNALKKRHLLSQNTTSNRISEEEYWRLFNSHSKKEDPPILSSKKTFWVEFTRIKNEKSNDLYLSDYVESSATFLRGCHYMTTLSC